MRFPKPLFLAVSLLVGLFLVVACGQATPEGECLTPQDGEMVPISCDAAGTPFPTPTPTPGEPGNGGNNGGGGGQQVFLTSGCSACHTIEGVSTGQVGPNLSQVGGAHDAEYIRRAIIEPNADIAATCPAGPCQPNVMPGTYGTVLTAEQIDSLVEYLSGLQ